MRRDTALPAHAVLTDDQHRVALDAASYAGKAALQQLGQQSPAEAGQLVGDVVVRAWLSACAALSGSAAPGSEGS